MTLNIDPATIVLGIFVVGWIFRVDRKLTRIETWVKSCKFCRESLRPSDDNNKKGE